MNNDERDDKTIYKGVVSRKEVWTDMRPLNLRKKMEQMAKETP